MRPQDIEKAARSVVGAFSQAGDGGIKGGCGAFSNPQAYECIDFGCTANYECGEAGNFTCGAGEFSCTGGFFCTSDYTG